MIRVIRALLGKSRREAEARAEMEAYRVQHAVAMKALEMKVEALDRGARRMVTESRRTQEAAAELMAHLREDLV